MRKEDRIRQQQDRSEKQDTSKSRPEPREREKMRGTANMDQPQRPERPSGKLPLPD